MQATQSTAPCSVLFPQLLLPLAAAQVGRLITSMTSPGEDFHDPVCGVEGHKVCRTQMGYRSVESSVSGRGLETELTKLLSLTLSRRSKTTINVNAKQANSYHLQNSTQWFKRALGLPETRRWLEQYLDAGNTTYLIVGFYTIADAHIVEQISDAAEVGGKVRIPIAAALAANGIFVPGSDIMDPSLGTSRGSAQHGRRSFYAPGEQICAIQVRKLNYRWWPNRKVASATLEKGVRWERYDRFHSFALGGSSGSTNEDGPAIVELSLDGMFSKGDHEAVIIPNVDLDAAFK